MAGDGGWGWMVVLGSFICHFFLVGVMRSMGIVYVQLQERFEASATNTAFAASIFVSLCPFGGPIASKLSNKFGCRVVTMTGGLLLCIGFVLSSLSIQLFHVYLTLGVVGGVGGTLVLTPSYVAVSQWFNKKKGKAMASSSIGAGLGNVCMSPLIALFIDEFSYFGTMLITGALLLNNAVGGALYRTPPATIWICQETLVTQEPTAETGIGLSQNEEASTAANNSVSPAAARDDELETEIDENATTPPGQSNGHHETFSHSQINSDTSENTRVDVGRNTSDADDGRKCLRVMRSSLWTNFPFIMYCIVVSAVQGCTHSVLVFLPARGRELGAGPKAAALLLTVFGVCDLVGRFIFGFVFDLRAVRRLGRSYLYMAVAALFGATTAAMAAASNYATLVTCTCIVVLLEGAAHGQTATSVTEMVELSQMAQGVGLVFFAQSIGNFYGPIVGGALKDKTGSYASCFLFGGTTLFAACILATTIRLLRCRKQSSTTGATTCKVGGDLRFQSFPFLHPPFPISVFYCPRPCGTLPLPTRFH